jgi:GNAT superfamily N-acetyltransferase
MRAELMNGVEAMNAIATANIHNLTSLWRRMGSVTTTRVCGSALNRSLSWPHRAWLEIDQPLGATARMAEQVEALRPTAVFPVWGFNQENPGRWQSLLVSAGLKLQSVLTAMFLPITDPVVFQDNVLAVTTVSGSCATQKWARLCSRSFGYQVDSAVIDAIASSPEVLVLQGLLDDVPVASALLYRTGSVVGIHQVGVDPDWRGRGVARAMMKSVMDWATTQWQPEVLVLQASREGLGLYRQLGFIEQFRIGLYSG